MRIVLGGPATAIAQDIYGGATVDGPGALCGLSIRADGGLRASWTHALGTGAQPAALAMTTGSGSRPELLVLDRASDRVLILSGKTLRGLALVGSLPTGHDPAAMTWGNPNSDQFSDLLIAAAGADAVTVWSGGRSGTFGSTRLFATGSRPVDVVSARLDARDYDDDLAVANAGSGTVTVLHGDGKGGMRRGGDIALGGEPFALAPFYDEGPETPISLNGDELGDIAVLDRRSALVTILLGTKNGPRVATRLPLPASGRPTAIAVGYFNRDENLDAVVAQSEPGSVTVLLSDGRGHLSPQAPIPVSGQPSAMLARDVAGDSRDDVLVVDQAGAVDSIVFGDRLVALGLTASIRAVAGNLYYVQRVDARWRVRRVAQATGPSLQAPQAIPIRASAHPVSLYTGRDPVGRPELTYVRCSRSRHHCAPYAWRLPDGPETAIRPTRPVGCAVAAFGRWRDLSAYELQSSRRGSCHAPGLWVKASHRRLRRLVRNPVALRLVHRGRVAYVDARRNKYGNQTLRLRLASNHGITTLDSGEAGGVGCDSGFTFVGPVVDDRHLYWVADCHSSLGSDAGYENLKRARVSAPRCASSLSGSTIGDIPLAEDVTVERGRVFYTSGYPGIFELSEPPRWPPARCRQH